MPEAESPYPILRLRAGRDRAVAVNRHPWLFRGNVHAPDEAQDGDIVTVVDDGMGLIGYGHYAAKGPIACRMLAFAQKPLVLDEAFWLRRLERAWAWRERFLNPSANATTGYRMVNAEGDHLPGIVIDRYGQAAVMQLRTPGARTLRDLLTAFLVDHGIPHVYVKHDGRNPTDPEAEADTPEVEMLTPSPDVPAAFTENGFRLDVLPGRGQKTGFFLDQRANRQVIEGLSQGRRVLNAFSYTGAFGLYALRGGAQMVTSLDGSAQALEQARHHTELNGLDPERHPTVKADAFHYLTHMDRKAFDLIILDPPAFTKSPQTVDRASRGYKEINLKAMQKIAPGGILATFSCSQHVPPRLFRQIVFGAAADAGRPVRLLHTLGHGVDHPVDLYHPEGEYLKGLVLVVD